MVSIVSAVRPPQRWPGDSGVGGALVQSHPCRAPVGGGGGGTRMHYVHTPVGVQQTGKIDELCVCVRACMCIHGTSTSMYPQSTPHHTHLHGMLQVPGGCTEAVEGVVLPTM